MMESLRNKNNNNSDKEDGELSNDDDNNSIQGRSFTVDSQHAGKRHRKKRNQVIADQSRNANRFKPRPLLRNYRHQQEDAGRYSYCSPAKGLRNGDAICHDDRQKLPERKTLAFPGQRRMLTSQERRISSPKRAFSSQRKYFPSRKRAHSSQKVAISSQMFKQRNLKSDTDTQDALRRLELEHEQIKQQLKMLDEEEEQSREQDDNEIQPSGYDSLLDVMEILNNLDEDIEDGKENISVPKTLNRPPFLNKVEKEGSCKLPPQISDIMMGLLMSQPNMSCSVVTPPERCDIDGNLHQEVLSVPPHDLTDLTTSLNVLNGLTACEKMPSAFSLSSDNERTASFTDPPKQIPVHYGSHRENKSGNLSRMRGKSAVNNHSIYTIYDAGISGRPTPKPKQTYGRGKRCSDKTSFCQPFPKTMKMSFLAAIPLLQKASEVVSVSSNGCDSDEEDVEDVDALRVKLLEDVQEKRKTVGECPANEIAPVHECADLESSEASFVFDERVAPPVWPQDIVRLSPSVLSMSQEDINENLCQNSSQLLNDHQEEQSPTELCDMKLTAEESSSKPQSQFMLQPLECLPSTSFSTKNLLMDLNAAITTAVKTPRIVLEEIQDTVQKSPVVPLVIVDRYIQKASQRSTGSQEPEATEVETISTISSQKDIDETSCSPDGSEHRPSIKQVALPSTTDCLIKVGLEEYCAKQPEVVDTNVPFSQASSESSAESTARLSPVESTALISPVQSTAQISSVQSTAQISPVESTAQISPVESTARLSPVESTARLSPVESTALISSVQSTAQISSVESTAQISPVESTAQISPVESTAQLSPVESAALISSAESTAQLSPVESTAQISPVESTAQISPVESTAQISPVESTAQLSPVESTAQLSPVESAALISSAESTAQLSPVESTAQISPVESTAQLSPVESAAQISSVEHTVQISTTEATVPISTIEATVQLSPIESTAYLSSLESTAQLFPVESTAQLSPVESTAQLSPVESTAQLSPVESTAHLFPVESTAQLFPVESTAQLFPVESTAQLSPVESTTQLFPVESTALLSHVESKAQLSPGEYTAWCNLVKSIAQLSTVGNSAQLSLIEPTAQLSPAESTTQLNPVEYTALVNPVESTAQLSSVESTAQLFPVESIAQLFPVESIAQLFPVESTAQLFPVESTAQLFPVESTAQLFPVESTEQLSPGEFTAWCNLVKSIAPLSTVEKSAQLSLIEPTAQLSPAESTTQLNPVESPALVNPVGSTALVNPVESTALVNPVGSTALVNPVESTAQLSPAKPVAQLFTGVCTAQMPLPRSTAQLSSASYETPHLTTCHASNNDPRNATYSNHLQMSYVPEKPRKFKQPFMLPIHPPVLVPLSPSSDSDGDDDGDDQRQTQTQEVPNSIKAHCTLGGQDTGKPNNEDESGKQATQVLRDKEQRLASLEQSMQAHQKKVQLLTEKEADNAKVLQLKKEELKNLFSQLITLKQEITNRNNLAIHYQAEIEKTQKEIQLLGKRKEHCQANKMRSELSESAADVATTTSPSACQSEVSRTDRNQSLSRAEERAQEKQKLMEREKTVKETLEKLKEEAAKKETRKFSTFISKRLRNTENKRKLLKINRIAKIHTLPQ